MIKEIVKDQSFLSQIADPATKEDLSLAEDLIDTLKAHEDHCVGLAANMIGVNKQAIVIKIGLSAVVMFNPVITQKKEQYHTEESCLSLDGSRETDRFKIIEVEYFDCKWKRIKKRYRGWTAQIIQHEMDHLKGILI